MRTSWSVGVTAALLTQTLFAFTAKAASFPDVPSNSPYRVAIETLADLKVINGNPDGTFAPDRTVNRAEFLTMLYRANKTTPATPVVACFTDVPLSAWFSPVVCDAASNSYVSGYAGKIFKPQQAVNRVEALKMMFTVLKLNQLATLDSTTKALAYTDVSASAWYMQYLSAAFKLNILPVPGVSSKTFGPDGELTRAEAAAFIYNAISPAPLPLSSTVSSSAATQRSSASSVATTRSSSSLVTQETGTITQVDFPFNDDGTFTKKLARSYRFTMKQTTTMQIQTLVSGGSTPDDVTCRLFKLDGDSFSLEYYIGFQDEDSCTLLSTLGAGSYQLDIQPRIAGLPFTVSAKAVKGDGNDGFTQAKLLTLNNPVSAVIDTNEYGDYYTFTLTSPASLMVELTNAENLQCVVYPMANVDIFGFASPDCNEQYDFPAGTYYIGVMQKNGHAAKQNYSVRFKK